MKNHLQGIAASDGIAIAKAYLLTEPDLSFEKRKVEDSEGEVARLLESFETAKSEVSAIREKAAVSLGEEEAQVFDAHLMVLSDPEMIGSMNSTSETTVSMLNRHFLMLPACSSVCSKRWKTTHTCKNVLRISATLRNVC